MHHRVLLLHPSLSISLSLSNHPIPLSFDLYLLCNDRERSPSRVLCRSFLESRDKLSKIILLGILRLVPQLLQILEQLRRNPRCPHRSSATRVAVAVAIAIAIAVAVCLSPSFCF
eukprot:TRINITY_DN75_c0_g3_i1.p2 TRINITY_DN75_c0_g3~~TRINITY_DN75_c0_g3_i1.p2  ORF type:complete len:115 (+),score=18.90 TRINITY_DN75_c0_g3_i1:1048-1392(+)